LFLLVLSLCVVGCASSPKPAATTQAENVINELTIRTATFGVGLKVKDVTPRVIYLLRNEPHGFSARKDWLHVDPAPYKRKVLTITYEYQGKAYTLAVTDQLVNYDLLLKHAKR
jgi:hypothetical protein